MGAAGGCVKPFGGCRAFGSWRAPAASSLNTKPDFVYFAVLGLAALFALLTWAGVATGGAAGACVMADWSGDTPKLVIRFAQPPLTGGVRWPRRVAIKVSVGLPEGSC